MANTYAYRTMDLSTDGGYTSRFVFSAWVKRTKLSYSMAPLFSLHKNNSNTASRINCYFDNNDNILFKMKDSGGSDDSFYATNKKFRDTNSWYHIYLAYNSTLSTAADRLQIYVNGVRETSFSSANEVGSDFGALMSNSMDFRIGLMKENDGTAYYFDGLMNSAIFTNYQSGTVDPVTDFGEVDSTTGEWKIKVTPAVTYGTQGVFVLKNGNSLTDQSGQSNNMTVGGTLTKTEDNPSNVFATMNPLDNFYAGSTFSNGNNSVNQPASKETYNTSTLGFASLNSGKYYCEVKATDASDYTLIGIASRVSTGTSETLNSNGLGNGYAYDSQAGIIRTNGGVISGWSGSTYTNGDIIGVAVDTDNLKLYFSKNGVWQNSANPSSGTGSAAITSTSASNTGVFLFAGGNRHNDNTLLDFNFGNGYFGTTAVSSAGSNASGNGIFEYDVPTGFTALSTKGLNL